jgi:NAD(P)-dependent dehydrogenase (short-subunit alcohol dehydrogenase family)
MATGAPWRSRRRADVSRPPLAYARVNAVSPGFTKTNLNGYAGTETVEEGAREAVRVALLGPDAPTGTFTRWENQTIPW